MRDHAEDTMNDKCIISRYMPDAVDDFNVAEDNWQDDVEDTICGFKIVTNQEAMEDAEVVMIDAELRLPFDTVFDRRDKIRLTYRLGEFVHADNQETFRIVGQPIHGHCALKLKLVKDTEV
jgi:hypothetical protein